MPIHPLKGLALKLVGIRRDRLAGCQTVFAELADGSHIVLPIDWTDRGAPWVTPTLRGKEVRLSARGLLSLARAIETALGGKLGPVLKPSSASTAIDHAGKSNVSSHDRTGRMGRPDGRDAARPPGRVGKPAAQDAQRKRGRR